MLQCGREPDVAVKAYGVLRDHLDALVRMAQHSASIPLFDTPQAIELRNRFVRGQATEDDIRAWIRAEGLYATRQLPGGTVDFVGTAVQPTRPTGENAAAAGPGAEPG